MKLDIYLYERYRAKADEANQELFTTLEEKNRQLEIISTTDSLTNLYNRSKIDELLHYEMGRSQRHELGCSILLIDIDYFKNVNDTHGHQAGDTILKEFALIIYNSVRRVDYVARWGGEEFLIILPHTLHDNALIVANKLCRNVAKSKFSYSFSNTCSIGVSTLRDSDDEEALIERADKALYFAKVSGRNRFASENYDEVKE